MYRFIPHARYLFRIVYQLNRLARSRVPTRTLGERGSFHKTVSSVPSDWSMPSSRLHHSISSSSVTLPSLFLSISCEIRMTVVQLTTYIRYLICVCVCVCHSFRLSRVVTDTEEKIELMPRIIRRLSFSVNNRSVCI